VVVDWPTPANVKVPRSFLGLADYCRKFVKQFGVNSRPLIELMKNNVLFVWTTDH
jgi:hypothetical protein